ncbi:hypothetical protein BD779DRAFT_1455409 [Infundibulicybe gibba]|nr:hypothetical protein BD779DRAFT_1455409 [Infundibulicybe gibba]
MHVATLNAGKEFIPLWRGTFQCAPTDSVRDWDWVALTDQVWKEHGTKVAMCRPYIPGFFDHPPRNIAEKISSGYKAKEWQSYLYGLVPALLYNILPQRYWQNFCKLVYGIRLLHQRNISRAQLQDAHKAIKNFYYEFESIYGQRRVDRLHFIRPFLHALLHIASECRVVGDLGGEVAQPSNPYQNLSERGLQRCQTNALKASYPILDRDCSNTLPRYSEDIGDGYVLLRAKERYGRLVPGDEGRVIKAYIESEERLCGNNDSIPQDWSGPKVAKWARLRLPTGQTARSIWKETHREATNLRRARCVKLRLDAQIEFAEVEFYFTARIDGDRRVLALVRLFSRPDEVLFRQSYWTVWSVTELGNEGLRVVGAKDILSVVAIIPHDHRTHDAEEEPRFFVWEQLGQDMALLSDSFPQDSDDAGNNGLGNEEEVVNL